MENGILGSPARERRKGDHCQQLLRVVATKLWKTVLRHNLWEDMKSDTYFWSRWDILRLARSMMCERAATPASNLLKTDRRQYENQETRG